MSIGIFRGEHSFNAIINQTDKVITPINPFDNNARALLKSPGIKPIIFLTHQTYVDSIVREPGVLTFAPFLWKVTVKYKYFGLRTTVVVQPTPKD
jgi:hypothetical protein